MRKIVVTGAKGGTGPSLAAILAERGYEVLRTDVHPWTDADGLGYVQLDLRDAAGVNDIFAGADAVVHFGSPPADAWLSTTEAYHQVASAGFNVFQAATNTGVKRIAWASSIEVYGDIREHPALPVSEDSPLAPPGIYGAAKLLLERLARDYARWHGLASAGFRLSRIIYDNETGRAKLRSLVADEAFGFDCLWSYIDARDVGAACLAWLESDLPGAEVFNLAAVDVHQKIATADLLAAHGYGHLPSPSLADARQTPFSTAKIRAMLNWRESHNWREIIERRTT
ncbi:MAG: NAD(P)-dependent oxidoreductase [Candidatus Latescibacteria bacterium]|jgi:nucleoside-diphosphate-sugar epimerase|nr:NAD(P)-dependent oxidoreductase [Candidatus Latescibacterota bacterium]